MSTQLVNSVAQSLVEAGLDTVPFESLVPSFSAHMHGYLTPNNAGQLKVFEKACSTANTTLYYCEPVVALGVLTQVEIDSLVAMQRKRNTFAYEGDNQSFELAVSDVQGDVGLML